MRHIFKAFLILLLIPILSACFTVTPRMDMQQLQVPITNRQDLDVAVIVPPATRNYTQAHEIQGGCWSGGLIFAPSPYGEMLTKTLHNRFSFMFSSVTMLQGGENTEDFDAVFTANMTDAGIKLACGISPNQFAEITGSLQAIDGEGRPIWSSAKSMGRYETGMSYDMDFNRIYGEQFSKAIASLVDGWVSELVMTQPPRYAYNVDVDDYGNGASFASNNSNKRKKGFATKPLKIKYQQAQPDPDDIVVIISNANYGRLSADIPDVVPAYADAKSMKKYAMQALGVREGNIIDLQDATSAQLVSVFGTKDNHKGKLFDWIRPKRSKVFVYYVGHGAPSSRDGSAYLVPVDADAARIDLNGYPLSVLYNNLAKLNAEKVTVVVEACFSGASNEGSVISNASPVYLKAEDTSIPDNITVITAGSLNQIASWEEDKSNSLFTKYFLRGQSGEADMPPYGNQDGQVNNLELEKYLDDTMSYYARRYYGREQQVQIRLATY